MKKRKFHQSFALAIGCLLLTGCSIIRPNHPGIALRPSTILVSLTGPGGNRHALAPGVPAAAGATLDRPTSLDELDKEFQNAQLDMQRALSYITTGQVKDYYFRKNVGFAGVLFGAVSTTLNVASKANIVTSTAFTAFQTGITGYLGTSDGLINPNSNEQLSQTKTAIQNAYTDYVSQRSKMKDTTLADADWLKAFTAAASDLGVINFQCYSVLPSPQS